MNGMKVLQKSFLILTGIFFFFVRAGAQTSFPTVSYTQDFEESNPSHYEIIVSNDGQVTVAALFHAADGGADGLLGVDYDRVGRHEITDLEFREIAPSGLHDGIALR